MGICERKGEQGDKCTPVKYVKMVEAEVDDITLPSTQAEFGIREVSDF